MDERFIKTTKMIVLLLLCNFFLIKSFIPRRIGSRRMVSSSLFLNDKTKVIEENIIISHNENNIVRNISSIDIGKNSAKVINRMITDTFRQQSNFTITNQDVKRLQLYLEKREDYLTQFNVITLLHRCAKFKQDILQILPAPVLLDRLDSGQASSQGIANALYGIPSLLLYNNSKCNDKNEILFQFLKVMTKQIQGCREYMDGQAITNAIYGFRYFKSDNMDKNVNIALRLVLGALSTHVHKTTKQKKIKIRFSSQGLGIAMLGLQGMSSSIIEVSNMLSLLTVALNECPEALDAQAVANMMLGLKSMSIEDKAVKDFLSCVVERVKDGHSHMHNNDIIESDDNVNGNNDGETLSSFYKAEARELSMALWGIQGLTSDEYHVREFLTIVANILVSSSSSSGSGMNDDKSKGDRYRHSTQHEIGGSRKGKSRSKSRGRVQLTLESELMPALGGMQRMSSDVPEVRRLLGSLAAAFQEGFVVDSTDSTTLNSNGINRSTKPQSNTGQSKSPSRKASRLTNLPALKISSERYLGCGMYGLQNMSNDYAEVRAILRVISKALSSYSGRLSARALATTLYGLKNMNNNSNNSKEVLNILYALSKRIDKSMNALSGYSGQHVAMMCQGFQSMNSQSKEVRALLDIIATLLERGIQSEIQTDLLEPKHFAGALYGLQNMDSSCTQVKRLRSALYSRLEYSLQIDSQLAKQLSGPEVAMAMCGLRSMPSDTAEAERLYSLLAMLLRESAHDVLMSSGDIATALASLQAAGPPGASSTSNLNVLLTKNSKDKDKDSNFGNADNVDNERSQMTTVQLDVTSQSTQARSWTELEGLLDALVHRLNRRGVESRLTGREVGVALYGLQGFPADFPGVETILEHLADDLERHELYDPLSSRHVASALYGMQRMNPSRSPVVARMLSAIADAMNTTPHPLNAQAIGNALYGLQNCCNDHADVEKVLSALADKLEIIELNDDINTISNTNRNKIDYENENENEDKRVERERYELELSGQNIGNALWGLKNMNSDTPQVRRILGLLAKEIQKSKQQLNGQNIGNALYGLHGMNSDQPEVREMLQALAYKVVQSSAPLRGIDVGMALYGLRSMDPQLPEVRVLLGTLLHKVRSQKDMEIETEALSLAMMGVINSSSWIRDDFMSVLATRAKYVQIR